MRARTCVLSLLLPAALALAACAVHPTEVALDAEALATLKAAPDAASMAYRVFYVNKYFQPFGGIRLKGPRYAR